MSPPPQSFSSHAISFSAHSHNTSPSSTTYEHSDTDCTPASTTHEHSDTDDTPASTTHKHSEIDNTSPPALFALSKNHKNGINSIDFTDGSI